MKKNSPYLRWKNILLMPLFLLLIASMTTTSVKANPLDLFIDPPTATINAVGQKVTVTVNVTAVSGCSGFDIRIYYNQSILSYTVGNYTVDGPGQVFPTTGVRYFTDASIPGDLYLVLALSQSPPNLINTTGGIVVWITFQGLMEGVSNLTFNTGVTGTFVYDSIGNPMTIDNLYPGQITVIPEFPAAIATLLLLTTTLTATLLGKTIWSKKHHTKNKTN